MPSPKAFIIQQFIEAEGRDFAETEISDLMSIKLHPYHILNYFMISKSTG